MKNNDDLLIKILNDEWILFLNSISTLHLSVEKCKRIGIKEEYSFEEEESFDSLSSKFSRTSDIFTQKVLRTVWMLLHEPFLPFIDFMNVCEKIQLIHSATALIMIRDLRNQIAHEYIPEAIRELAPELMDLTKKLIENKHSTELFLKNRNWI